MKKLPKDLNCFVCGRDNPIGLRLDFEIIDSTKVRARFTPKEHFNGFKGTLHGGIISSVLDDAMDWALYNSTQKLYVTSELKVNFKKPAPVDKELIVVAESLPHSDGRVRKIELARAELFDSEGNVLAVSEGKFFALSGARETELLNEFIAQ